MIYKISDEYQAVETLLKRNGIPYEAEESESKYMVVVVRVNPYGASDVQTMIKDSKISAYAEYLTIRDELYNEQEDVEYFKKIHVLEDYTFMNSNKYFHAVYNEGEELIIKVVKVEV